MNDEPKLIYKYTHAQAVANGDLHLIPNAPVTVPFYVSDALKREMARWDITNQQLMQDFSPAFLGTSTKNMRSGYRKAFSMSSPSGSKVIKVEIVFGCEIRDDDKVVPCLTVVLEGEL